MNRRSEPRFDVYYRAKISPVDNPERQIDAQLTDISGGGMRLVSMQELPEDQVICVEVGQHLVLAEVRSSVPRGSRFLIGAEKVHTLNLLTLPESTSPADRIQALVDDYHLRIQFALESNRKSEKDDPALLAKLPEVAKRPAPPPGPVPAQPQVTPPAKQPTASVATPPTTPVVGPTAPGKPGQDPGLAPPIRTDPTPAAALAVPVSAAVEVDFGQLRIILPEVQGLPEMVTETPKPPEVQQRKPLATLEAPAQAVSAEQNQASPSDETVPDLPPPVQPIWMSPPGGKPLHGETRGELDPLRALAIQHDSSAGVEPKIRNHSRTIAALAAAVVAAGVLAGLLFGPIRNRALLLSPFAWASDGNAKKASNPKDLVIQVDSGASKPAEVKPTEEAPPEASPAPAPTPKPTTAPAPAKAPIAASTGTRVHSSTVRTLAPSWIWACADGKPLAGKMLAGGSDLEIEFSKEAKVLVGNAGAVEMDLDGKPLGPLGADGRARVVELTPDGFHLASSAGAQECGNR